jgi:hypothetical protein
VEVSVPRQVEESFEESSFFGRAISIFFFPLSILDLLSLQSS